MELEELKEAWTALDNKLKRNEELKESIILEMMQSKAVRLVDRFVTLEIIAVVMMLLTGPLCILWLDRFKGIAKIYLLFTAVICFIYSLWGVFKIHGLMKFDVSKDVSNNIYYVNRYNHQINRYEKKFYWCFLVPAIVIFLTLSFVSMKVTLSLWVLMICAVIAGILFSYWSYKRYNKNMDSILRSIDEIRELKEE